LDQRPTVVLCTRVFNLKVMLDAFTLQVHKQFLKERNVSRTLFRGGKRRPKRSTTAGRGSRSGIFATRCAELDLLGRRIDVERLR
ncbi:unnamed protein product, partial [Ectocarpus sp. 12 AP-2014]